MIDYNLIKVPASFKEDFFKMKKKEVEEYFDWFIENIPQRLLYFNDFLAKRVEGWNLQYDKINLSLLGEYFPKQITSEELSLGEKVHFIKGGGMKIDISSDSKLSNASVSFCFDLGIYFGECLRKECKIEWLPCIDSKKNASYGQPVLKKRNAKIELNPRLIIENLAHVINSGQYDNTRLISLFDTWLKLFK